MTRDTFKSFFNNILYFTDSPGNIIIVTELAESTNDDYGTLLLTKRKDYIFTWNFGKYKNKISHSENCLPELYIQAGLNKFDEF